MHTPVLLNEVNEFLNPRPGEVVFDLTAGSGGHALEFAKKIGKDGMLIIVDWDKNMLQIAEKRLMDFFCGEIQIISVRSNFALLDDIIREVENFAGKVVRPDILFADLGISSYHLEWSHRGFSFSKPGPLDMRISDEIDIKAKDVIMRYPQYKIEEILRRYGEERLAKKIAREIVIRRQTEPIEKTDQLAEIVERVYRRAGLKTKIHPATKTFQALRIYVNRELENLAQLLEKIPYFCKEGTRVGIISFHSLEDRIVKRKFSEWMKMGYGKTITKGAVVPSEKEIILNPRSRSARFRAFVFLSPPKSFQEHSQD